MVLFYLLFDVGVQQVYGDGNSFMISSIEPDGPADRLDVHIILAYCKALSSLRKCFSLRAE